MTGLSLIIEFNYFNKTRNPWISNDNPRTKILPLQKKIKFRNTPPKVARAHSNLFKILNEKKNQVKLIRI